MQPWVVHVTTNRCKVPLSRNVISCMVTPRARTANFRDVASARIRFLPLASFLQHLLYALWLVLQCRIGMSNLQISCAEDGGECRSRRTYLAFSADFRRAADSSCRRLGRHLRRRRGLKHSRKQICLDRQGKRN